MNDFANFCLVLAWLLAVFGFLGGLYAGWRKNLRLSQAVANATVFVGISTCLSLALLAYLFLTSDFSNQYVWQFSNRAMDPVYKISAVWGGMDGSMLLWCGFLSLSAAILAARSNALPRELRPFVLAVANSSTLFFLTIVFFVTNPFRYIKAPFIPPDGNGLNPLLQNPLMAIHPPLLYLGFTTFAIPYAFCFGALCSGNLNNEWIRLTRRWTLIAWSFLTAGIVLGGHWAYVELGWGGFWAWDPVENASFLPWLTGTAFLHSVMVQERKNMLKFWNVWLVTLTYGLTVFGTFLTRSGVVQSVHAFASTDVGWVFLLYLGVLFVVTAGLCYWRRVELRSERKLESLLSREAFFMVNNLLFLGIMFATLWGVMFPVLSEALTGTKQTVSIPFFNAVNVPLFLLLVFLMGVGPLIAWRKASWNSLRRTFLAPFLISLVLAVILVWAGINQFYPVLSYSLCAFVVITIFGELHRGLSVQRAQSAREGGTVALTRLVKRHYTRYGGYLVHIGVVFCVIGITASMAHKVEKEFSLSKGESLEIGRFELHLENITSTQNANYSALVVETSIKARGTGELLGVLRPEMRRYMRNDENTTEVALRSTLREDLYLVVAGLDNSGTRAALKVFINPLQVWLWFGAIIMVVGGVLVALPRPSAQRVTLGEREALAERARI